MTNPTEPLDPILCTAVAAKQPERDRLQSDVDHWLQNPANRVTTYAMGESKLTEKLNKKKRKGFDLP